MSHDPETSTKRLRIWQQNLNKSDKAHFDLINSPLHQDWDLLLLQEPYIDTFGNTKANSKWHTLYPSSHLTDEATDRSIILVNAALDTNVWAQVPFVGSNDVTAIQIQLLQGQITVYNIYNNCRHSCTLERMQQHLAQQPPPACWSRTGPRLVVWGL